jgi:two-component system, NarL family, response regulator NreC
MTKVVIADDHAIVRTGLRALIQADPGLELVGEASGGLEAVELVGQFLPDVVVLDVSMPDLDGISVTRRVKVSYPNTRILILTVHEDEALLREAIKAGASGYILKRAAETELVAAIQVILRGDLYVDPAMLRSLLDDQVNPKPVSPALVEPLTPREVDVLRLIVEGYTNKQVAEQLSISTRTVEGHRANLSEKLGLHSRVELVRYAREHGLID